jgi:murein DD-endopeptidase MepM/ murein hydrolase activator NlpD
MMYRFRQSIPLLAVLLAVLLAACGPALRPLPPLGPVPATPAEPPAAPGAPAPTATAALRLMVPVEGIDPARIPDSFSAARDGQRVHRAVDILAPRGTPVLAADSGVVLRLSSNNLGGITVYALDHTARYVFYYAHLERYRDDLAEGMKLAQGDVIGYVGTTGNAPPNTPHLHFQVMLRREDGRYWEGTPLDPLPFFTRRGQQR